MEQKISLINKIDISDHAEYTDTAIIARHTLTKDVKLHRHSYYEIEYVTSGYGEEKLNGREIKLSGGSLQLISPSDFHEIRVDGHITISKICFDGAGISPSVFNRAKKFLSGAAFQTTGEHKDTFDELFNTAERLKDTYSGAEGYYAIAKSVVETVLLCGEEYLKLISNDYEPIRKGDIEAVLTYVHANFQSRMTLASVAERMHFSPSYLSRRFHDAVGTTFVAYVKGLRLEYAAGLLKNTDAEITEICYESGFSSPSCFTNDFRKCYGLSPTKYREATRSNRTGG